MRQRIFLWGSLGFLLLSIFLAGCGAAIAPTPAQVPGLLFVTITPTPPNSASLPVLTPAVAVVATTPVPQPTPTATAAATDTATPAPPTTTPWPHVVINSPAEALNVRIGPGLAYDPPVGAFNNGALVDVLGKQYSPEGDLWWLIPFAGGPNERGWIYAKHTFTRNVENVPWVAPPPLPTGSPTTAPTATATLATPPLVTWTISGSVTRVDNSLPVPDAQVTAILGSEASRLEVVTGVNGYFWLTGQARDEGALRINIRAVGYQPNTLIFAQTRPRVYDLPDIQLAPLNESCRYESVLDVPQSSAISRLRGLGFTSVMTITVDVIGNQTLVDLVLTQEPEPPTPDRLVKLGCTTPITLGVGVEMPGEP